MTSTSAKKKAPAKKKTAAKKAPAKKPVVAKVEISTPDYSRAASTLIRDLGFSSSPHPDHVKIISKLLAAAFEHGRMVGKG
tara:strand:+ start:1278 stop:1520 length:243 start_codon:yes stop_codon:yes gene_type:complete